MEDPRTRRQHQLQNPPQLLLLLSEGANLINGERPRAVSQVVRMMVSPRRARLVHEREAPTAAEG